VAGQCETVSLNTIVFETESPVTHPSMYYKESPAFKAWGVSIQVFPKEEEKKPKK
jgi:hypothetical protein